MLFELLQRNAAHFPNDIALSYGEQHITHAELVERVENCALGLESAGVGPGDRVALLLESTPSFVVSFFAIAARSAISVPLNPLYKEEELRFYFRDTDSRSIITTEQHAQLCEKAASDGTRARPIVVTPEKLDLIACTEAQGLTVDRPRRSSSLDNDLLFLYSSGSTGRPKRVPRTVLDYWWEIENIKATLDLGRDDTIFCAIPLFHNYGLVNCMLAAAGSGARLLILEEPNPFILRRRYALELLERERVTVFPGVPFQFRHLVETKASAELPHLRLCISAGTGLPVELFEAFYEKFRVPIRQHYGCSELGGISINLDEDPRPSAASVGHPLLGVSIKIVDEEGAELPDGEVGEIAVASRSVTRGYADLPELNRIAFRDGFFFTGDLGCLDEQGRLTITGRKKLLIEVAGAKIDPVEIEDVLMQHAAVREVVVVGIDDPTGGEQIAKACVVADKSCTERDLISFCQERLANFKVPQLIEFRDEIPKSPIGKVLRKYLI